MKGADSGEEGLLGAEPQELPALGPAHFVLLSSHFVFCWPSSFCVLLAHLILCSFGPSQFVFLPAHSVFPPALPTHGHFSKENGSVGLWEGKARCCHC